MTRAVAEEGVELIKGVHKGCLGGLVITIKQANGLVREVPYREEAVATPVLIEAMIQDIGIENPEIREAAREYCLNYIKGWNELFVDPETDGISVSDLDCYVEAFIKGYEAALKQTNHCQ